MKHWFVLNGIATSGKGFFVERMGNFKNIYYISSVGIIKDICRRLGWDGNKDDLSREALSEFKKLSIKYFNHPFNYIKSELECFKNSASSEIFFVDVREPEEIDKLVNELGFKTIFVKNRNVKHIPNNDSDSCVEQYNYDYIIDNSGTAEDLDKSILEFLDIIEKI